MTALTAVCLQYFFLYLLVAFFQALVLEPTYELAQQTAMVIRKIVNGSVDVTVIEAVRGSRRKFYHFPIEK